MSDTTDKTTGQGGGPAGLEPVVDRVRAILTGVLPTGGRPVEGTPLRELGLDSLSAARLVLELQLAFGVEVPLLVLSRCEGVRDLAAWLAAAPGSAAASGSAAGSGSAPSPVRGPQVRPDPGARYEPFALTPLQQAYLTGKHPELSPDPIGCHIYREFEVPELDVDRLCGAWRRVVERQDALRIELTDDHRQRVRPPTPLPAVPVHQRGELAPGDFEARVVQVRERMSHRRYEPGEWPLWSLEVSMGPAGRSVVHLSIDALLTDGAGLDRLLESWWDCYAEPDQPLPEPAVSVRDALEALREHRSGPAHRDDLAYWTGRLAELPPGPQLPAGPSAPGWHQGRDTGGWYRRRALTATLPAGQWAALRRRAAALGGSATALVLAAFVDTLLRYGAVDPFSLVLTTSQRSRLPAEVDPVVGPFTSTTLLVVAEAQELRLDQLARQLHQRLWEDLDHAAVCGVEVLRELRGARRDGAEPVLPVVFTSLLDATRRPARGGFATAVRYATSQTSGVALDAQLGERDGELWLHWDVADAMLPAGGVAEVLFADFVNALAAASSSGPDGGQRRPLNELQQAYYVARNGGPADWDGCQVYHSFRVPDLDVARLESAWARMLAAYDPLRSVVSGEGELRVRAEAPPSWRIPVIDLAEGTDRAVAEAALAQQLVSHAFPLDRWPQFDLRVTRAGGRDATVHLTLDLIICDGRSVHFLPRELFRLYANPQARPRPAGSYQEYVTDRQRLRSSHEYPQWIAHWRDRLAALPSGPALPMPGAPGGERRRVRYEGRVADWPAMRERAGARGIGPDALLLAVLTGVLASRFREPFALPVVRWSEAVGFRPGEFTALSWVAHRPDGTVWERAAEYQRELAGDAAADAVSGLAELRRLVLKRRRSGEFGYPVVYTGLLELSGEPLPAGVECGPWLTCTPDVSLDCIAMDRGDGELHCSWDVLDADFAPGVPAELFARFLAELRGLAGPGPAASGRPAGATSALPAEERHRILYEWNDTARPVPADGPVHLRFEEQARARPDAVALRWRGGSLTFRELDRWANAIAWQLREQGVGTESVVGIGTRRGPELVAAVYGVLKAGGGYLPVEPHLPTERATGMLADAGAVALLTTAGALRWTPPDGLPVTELDTEPALPAGDPRADRPPSPVNGVDHLAYVIYTSGSTGRPKGVAVSHRPLHNLFQWCARMFDFGPPDLGLCVTSLGFDLSVFDLLGLPGFGAAVYLADEEQRQDPGMLLDLLLAEPVTFWNSAPTTLDQLAPQFPAGGTPGTDTLRLVFLSGDYTPLPLPAKVHAAFPRAKLVSLGGATEATVWSNYFPVATVDPGWRSIPYGWPIDNSRYYLLDEQLDPAPPERAGDLYIAGGCLSRGYLGQPRLTAERFPPDPFARQPGERMYRTGDRATYFPDGTMCFLGRLDHQVKIRGFRVELGEIEHRLRRHPAVDDAVVLAHPDSTGDRKLVAYVVPAGARPTTRQLREHAAGSLPDYMLPNHVVLLDSFPATDNGKLDRAALPWPVGPAPEPDQPEQQPELAGLRDELATMFAGLLDTDQLDPDQDLWDQGATSFTMVQVSGALQKRYQRRVPVAALLADPTVSGITAAVAATLDGGAAPAPTAPPPVPAATSPPVSAPAATSPPAPGDVDPLDPTQRAAFRAAGWNRPAPRPDGNRISLPGEPVAAEHYRRRGSQRGFTGDPARTTALGALLRLLRPVSDGDRDRFLYPSAGDTYAVQVYLHVRVGGELPPGVYYYRPEEHALEAVEQRGDLLDRSAHFYYNRELYDRAAFELFLIGQAHGIAPLYDADSDRFLALEAGYLGQLLMSGQATAGLGLCPIGSVAVDRVRDALRLDPGQRFLQAFLGGPLAHPAARPAGELPLFTPVAAPPREQVAVIGWSGRFPGADDPAGLWRVLAERRRVIRPMPADRAAAIGLDGPLARLPGGFLDGLDGLDGLAFQLSPREAATLDPQARLLLEAVWRCLEDAGYTPDGLGAVGRVGVFVAVMWPDHHQRGADRWRAGEPAGYSGIAADLANRVSHGFGFQGPSVAVDTSCSSSLTAVHLASEGLRNRHCEAAVVAGVNLVTHPYHLALLTGLELVATGDLGAGEPGGGAGDGAFDAGASGWLPGEGVGAVLLRPAAAAADDRDAVQGVIEATGIAHAGRTVRFGAPDAGALAGSLRRTIEAAGLAPEDIDYVECAAAGAAVADAAELAALSALFGGRQRPVPVGTVKPNLGHLEAASGISQLAKVLLQLRHRRLAPTILAPRRSPLATWDPAALRVVEQTEPWPGARPRALVNALGATGSYAHLVIRAAAGEGDRG